MSEGKGTNAIWRGAWAAAFLALAAGAGVGFLRVRAADWPVPLTAFDAYDPNAMDVALGADRVGARLEKVLSFGPRLLGDEGLDRTAGHIREAFAAAGLKVISRTLRAAAPRTERRAITGADGKPLPGVEVFPFMPNHLQPMVTPPGGLAGRLVLVNDELLQGRPRFDDAIALVDAADPPKDLGFSWVRYGQLGFRALIVAGRGGLEKVEWSRLGGQDQLVASTPVNYVRLAATKAIFAHAGQAIRLDVRQVYRDEPAATIVGVLRGGDANATEAVAICAPYDSCSMLPDRAVGAAQATRLAELLALLDGVRAYKGSLRRDVIFVAHASAMMAHDGLARMLAAIGPNRDKGTERLALREEIEANRRAAASIEKLLGLFADGRFFVAADAGRTAIDALDSPTAGLFTRELAYVLSTIVFELSEAQLQAKIAFLHDETENIEGEPFRRYIAAKDRYNEAMTVAGYPLAKLLGARGDFVRRLGVAGRLRGRLETLAAFHAEQIAQLAAAVELYDAFARYKNIVVAAPAVLPAPTPLDGEAVSFFMGQGLNHDYQGPVINNVLVSLSQRDDVPAGLSLVPLARGHEGLVRPKINWLPQSAKFWGRHGYPAFALVNTDRLDAYQAYGWPIVPPWMRDLRTTRRSLWMLGRTVLSLAHGDGTFKAPKVGFFRGASFGGQVLAAGVGSSTVPNYPLAGALVAGKGLTATFEKPGWFENPIVFTDPYGRYRRANCVSDWIPWYDGSYSPNAAAFGADGIIAHIKDEGDLGQDIYKSMNLLTWHQETDRINVVTFRAAVTLLDLINPQTVKAYSAVDFITREGLSPLARFNRFDKANGIITTFVEPDRRFFVRLKAGGSDNELVQETRAFILGTERAKRRPGGPTRRVIDGPGYLAGDVPLLLDVPDKVARSMIEVNGRRLALQEAYNMADRRTRSFHAKAGEFLAASREPNQPYRRNILLARDAVAYATLNHPVLRESIAQAVVSIVWYLCLLVPFVFFFEKLLFALTDIRKQLVVQGAVFLVVFALLWALHPAFQMIRSSLMILLGFVILLISGGITVLFAGKFQENLEQLKTRRGVVAAAEVNTLGVVATAFMLGLNNMHRRRLRTLLTCTTLVLITFAMICFTSVHSDLVDTAVALGKASFQGVLFRKDDFQTITDGETFALQTRYGEQFSVASRTVWVGEQTWERQQFNPELEIVYQPAGSTGRKVEFESIMQFDVREPLAERVRFLTKTGWFDANSAEAVDANTPVLIPKTMADELGISAGRVDAGGVAVQINGKPFTVRAIFDDEALERIKDLNGYSLLPFNVEGMTNLRRTGSWEVIADEETDPRVPARRVVLALNGDLGIQSAHAKMRRVSVAVWMPRLRYKEAREQIESILEKSGRRMHYGLDGVAYVGQRARESSFAGLLDLVIPLVLAGLTVLNTMRGSVYERRDEIFVYNAVGIAPRYVFFMFFAEAFVYAVVGTVAGFLLSQGTGRALTALGWTGGLNMTFTSVNTIYTSLAIAAAVFASTYFPARSAMQIAAAAEEAGWKLPAPDGDEMRFVLPFTFSPRDRIAVLAFFHRYLTDHGEGRPAGAFFADVPKLGIADEPDRLAGDAYVPQIAAATWLKPFDLGVSQELSIAVSTDEDTGEFIARVTLKRLSGTRQSWLRLNHTFVRLVRRQFLHWRAVRDEQRAEMFEEGKALLSAGAFGGEVAHV